MMQTLLKQIKLTKNTWKQHHVRLLIVPRVWTTLHIHGSLKPPTSYQNHILTSYQNHQNHQNRLMINPMPFVTVRLIITIASVEKFHRTQLWYRFIAWSRTLRITEKKWCWFPKTTMPLSWSYAKCPCRGVTSLSFFSPERNFTTWPGQQNSQSSHVKPLRYWILDPQKRLLVFLKSENTPSIILVSDVQICWAIP